MSGNVTTDFLIYLASIMGKTGNAVLSLNSTEESNINVVQ